MWRWIKASLSRTNDPRHKAIIKDQMGRFCINPFAVPFEGSDELIESSVRLNFFLPDIKSKIDREIVCLKSEGRHREAEKWHYLDQLIGGPVLNAAPQLRRFGTRHRSAVLRRRRTRIVRAWSEDETKMLALVCRGGRRLATYLLAVRRGLVSARWSEKLP